MKCTVCGSESCEILKSKGKTSKELLLKCNKCGNIFRETVEVEKPVDVRVVVSEYESSHKTLVKLYPDEFLEFEGVLDLDGRPAQITSIENKRGGRVMVSPVSEIDTIWATYIDTPARVGISVDYGGRILSRKVQVDREFEFTIGDVVKLGDVLFKIRAMKTQDRKMRKGFAKAFVIKRVYGRPGDDLKRYQYDLTSKIFKLDGVETDEEK
ncbi:HVO_0476 family zinc finger protein [Methanobacterium sp. SMA-27]|uniref:HVO_0476 family zinc finger protein n=1 Tax=Methanobacterium sp. SMA-27 TaxID=1495336 RepID=UPI00064E6F3B|nr:HVO_0476 family zinc finger protein [Methanobacterium sp. SMA-27]